ncbi:hypothetical protein [Streptomyces sp. NRRL F-5126]|uniref:hypothetical protein n=1 Tax=Streptomyces sp. NRRL F-5126 TaxID=1463857 RepID=UPI0004C6B49D|nr:hypothetical protein [Streptomyces sp. NRRL F-5126]
MRTNIARAAAVVALGMAALVPVTGTAFADGHGHHHGRHAHHEHGVGFIGGHGSYTNLGGPYGITHAEGGFLAGGAH